MTISSLSISTSSDHHLNQQQQMASINQDFSSEHERKAANVLAKRSSAGYGNKLSDSMELIKLQIRKSQQDQNELFLENHVDSEEEQQGDDNKYLSEEEKENDWGEDDNNNESEEEVDLEFFPATNFKHPSIYDKLLKQSAEEYDDKHNAKEKGRKLVASHSQEEDYGFEFVADDEEDVQSNSDSEGERSVDKPFWYGFEEEDQVKLIMQLYNSALSLDEDRKKQIREPPPFIGRIKRIKVDTEDNFTTLDQATVYSRSIVCPGTEMPIKRTASLLTTWSSEDGLPIEIEVIGEDEERNWNEEVAEEETPQYIFCMPVYESPSEFRYYVSGEDRHVTYSPSGRVNSQVLYQDVIPEALRFPQSDEVGDSDSDPFRN